MFISVIAPAYNEEKLLPIFLKEVVTYLEKMNFTYELIIVENGSQDKTLEIARNFSKKNKRIKVEHLSNPSYGGAMIRGIEKAKGDYIVFFNIDFWDKRFIDLIKVDLLGYDIVVGSKNLPGSLDRRPFSRRLVTRVFNFFLRIFFGYKGTDTHGIKVLRREKLIPIVGKCRTTAGIFDSEMLIRAQRFGMKILELPVEVIEKRPNRFGFKRILETPKDIFNLFWVLRCK
jgi:glycosyltransferase involved in cell wall biosynthesis